MKPAALDSILFFEDLQVISRRKRLADVEKWATEQEIPFKYDAKGGIWTTIDAVNASMGVRTVDRRDWAYSPDIIV